MVLDRSLRPMTLSVVPQMSQITVPTVPLKKPQAPGFATEILMLSQGMSYEQFEDLNVERLTYKRGKHDVKDSEFGTLLMRLVHEIEVLHSTGEDTTFKCRACSLTAFLTLRSCLQHAEFVGSCCGCRANRP